jgi:hypothetical protein
MSYSIQEQGEAEMKTGPACLKTLVTLLLLFGLTAVIAALPPGLNYQGHLTGADGVPVDGFVSMTFRIYDVEAGGSALWTDTRVVPVQQGVFSIELGNASNPFPVGMFDYPLWIGLSVEADAEMLPRRPVTSTGYAFKAGDANTLDGSAASSLDQSAHVADTANPHAVTPEQIGASTGPHTVDTNAATICANGSFLNGDGTCDSGFLDADGVDAYNSAFDTEAEIDAAVADNGFSTGAHTIDTNAATICASGYFLNGDGSCDPVTVNTNAATICADGFFLNGDGSCDPVVVDTNAATICASGYFLNGDGSCDPVIVNTNAATICAAGYFLNGDGSCDPVPVNYPAVHKSERLNTSNNPYFFQTPHHALRVLYTGAANDFVIYSTDTEFKRVVIDDGTGNTVTGSLNTVGGFLYKNVSGNRIATIDVFESITGKTLVHYRCMSTNGTNLVICTQAVY